MEDASRPLAIGLDLGPSGVKAALVSADGRLHAESRKNRTTVLAAERPFRSRSMSVRHQPVGHCDAGASITA